MLYLLRYIFLLFFVQLAEMLAFSQITDLFARVPTGEALIRSSCSKESSESKLLHELKEKLDIENSSRYMDVHALLSFSLGQLHSVNFFVQQLKPALINIACNNISQQILTDTIKTQCPNKEVFEFINDSLLEMQNILNTKFLDRCLFDGKYNEYFSSNSLNDKSQILISFNDLSVDSLYNKYKKDICENKNITLEIINNYTNSLLDYEKEIIATISKIKRYGTCITPQLSGILN